MKNFKWVLNRFKSMSIPEVVWRIKQKILQKKEYEKYYKRNIPVTEITLSAQIAGLKIDINKLEINWLNQKYDLFEELYLLGDFAYKDYKNKWSAGFQTNNKWNESNFSYSIHTSQREDIGDIRTNWELNRHYQFVGLAKNFFITGDRAYLDELSSLFEHWNFHNLFLHGVEWTSAMEIAIRVNSWIYTYAFLEKGFEKYGNRKENILNELEHGVLVMAEYIIQHRARFSSANNHLIVEMYAVALSGIVFGYTPWIDYSIGVLSEELVSQNYEDGVNKELSLHYQTFVMETYGLLIFSMKKNQIHVPKNWYIYLDSMSKFVADSCGDFGETIVFGDNDEGKILDLLGKEFNHYKYVLAMMSLLLDKKYIDLTSCHENIYWLATTESIQESLLKDCYVPPYISVYKKGGYSFFRSEDKKVFIGIDHGELGFGKIAAHGHADALSFQMYVEGKPVFVDLGTYNYHVPSGARNYFRSTMWHNTAFVNGIEQSEMLGPFLWGDRAKTKLLSITEENKVKLVAEVRYENIVHKRTYLFNEYQLEVIDSFENVEGEVWQMFLINPQCTVVKNQTNQLILDEGKIMLTCINPTNSKFIETQCQYSAKYNHVQDARAFYVASCEQLIRTEIKVSI